MRIFAIVLSLVLSILGIVYPELLLSETILIVSFFLIATFGIIHGCNDLQLHKLNSKLLRFTQFTRIVIYISICLVVFFAYILSPQVCVILFVLFSAFHFGEEQIEHRFRVFVVWQNLLYFTFGSTILVLLFYLNYEATVDILELIQIPIVSQQTFLAFVVCLIIAQFAMILSLASLGVINWKTLMIIQGELILIGLLFYTTNLFMGFTVYFIFWHSLPSMRSQYRLMKRNFHTAEFKAIFIQNAYIYLVSLIGLFSIIYFVDNSYFEINLLLCSSIAITIPHVISIALAKSE